MDWRNPASWEVLRLPVLRKRSTSGLPDGAGLQVTVYDIRAADGKELNRVGVAPDDVVDTEIDQLASGDDPVLSRAVDILRNGGG